MTDFKHVTVTGGGGSLGRAFVRLLLSKNYQVAVVDNNEWALAEVKGEHPEISIGLMDFSKIDFDLNPTDALVHLAAYKHVGFGEENVESFVDNNIVKTGELFRNTYKFGIPTLYMSTDKAVEPVGVYGASKMIGEALARKYKHSIARCGNLLNSSGSVIPIWEKQIAEKQPITITSKSMIRYVIEDFDAANQIWSGFVEGRRLIIPKGMRELPIVDMLAEVLRRHGYKKMEEYDPGITIIGVKKGEKIREKLLWEWESGDGVHSLSP